MKTKLLEMYYELLARYHRNGDGFHGHIDTDDVPYKFITPESKRVLTEFKNFSKPEVQKINTQSLQRSCSPHFGTWENLCTLNSCKMALLLIQKAIMILSKNFKRVFNASDVFVLF